MVPVLARAGGVCRGAAAVVLCSLVGVAAPWHVASANAPAIKPAEKAADKPAQTRELAGSKSRTRFVIMLDRKSDFQVSSLQNPNRVIVDLPDVKVQLPVIGGDQPVGLVKSFRGGLAGPGKMRVVIDVTEPVIVEKAHLDPGTDGRAPRLILEIVPVDGSKAAAKKPFANAALAGLGTVQPPLPKRAERPEATAARTYKPLIVLDPGHGGHDGGAVRNGAIEKEVVLLFSLMLRDKLNATGRYKVLMTRDTDRFIPLAERREFAERNNAGLFIAIHADYAGSSARGATIYSLRDNVASELRRSARGEVTDKDLRKSEDDGAGTVKGILADLMQREVQVNKDRTGIFTRSVIEYMGTSTNMMSNPDRAATFAVLRTAKVPAVLMELAFVSNKEDAAKLKSDEWRAKVSATIVTAIDNYFSHQGVRLPM